MAELTIHIVVSILFLPVNICCAFWLFKEALNLTGMTFKEFLEQNSHAVFPEGRRGLRQRQQFLIRFFHKYSAAPQKSVRLMWAFGICTLPGLAALLLARYTSASANPDKLTYALYGNLILLFINIGLVIAGKIYRRYHPLDEHTAEILKAKRAKEKAADRKKRTKAVIVYTLTGIFFFSVILIIFLKNARMPATIPAEINHSDVNTVLMEKGSETANVPTTYWSYAENKLKNVCAGINKMSPLRAEAGDIFSLVILF